MAKSKAEICNLAISWLGGQTIFSLEDDTSHEAILCRANYEMSRTAVLEEREWSFALQRAVLTPLATPPEFGYTYAFLIPTDSQKILSVTNGRKQKVTHVIEGNQILCDTAELYVRYTLDLTNTKRFSALFDQALAAHIAANIVVPLTENEGMFQTMTMKYEMNLEKAISADSLQGSRERLDRSTLEASRRLFTREQ